MASMSSMRRSPVSDTSRLEQGDIVSTGSHYGVVESSTKDTVNVISPGGAGGTATRSVIPSSQALEKVSVAGQQDKNSVYRFAVEHIAQPLVDVGIDFACDAFVIACAHGKYDAAAKAAAKSVCEICKNINAKAKSKKLGR